MPRSWRMWADRLWPSTLAFMWCPIYPPDSPPHPAEAVSLSRIATATPPTPSQAGEPLTFLFGLSSASASDFLASAAKGGSRRAN